ncbi:hypothetical protein BC835DRAFT_1440239 [Cytidiella melzeri]|nr:hypothetical protein BC835DRAFT_1440239 [Cytidiella melzeri]
MHPSLTATVFNKKHVSYQRDKIYWEFIVAPGEKKKRNSIDDINDNVSKILWSFNHIMREDPCRRFVVGYTIENTDMRLWFCSRSDILVTEAFHFLNDHENLAHFFLSQMYAKPHELGYDPTMKSAGDPQLRARNQWDMTIHYVEDSVEGGDAQEPRTSTVTFRTITELSNIGAEAIRSRGTRVWKAQQLIDGKVQPELVVIKDYWVDDNRLREATIRKKILEDAPSDERRSILEEHLLTPLYFGDVVIDGQKDNTLTLLRRGAALPTDLEPFPAVHVPPLAISEDTVPKDMPLAPQGSGIPLPEVPLKPPITSFHDKSHHRIVFKETGNTTETITSMKTTLQVSGQALGALAAIHECGWVHRDISSGNILVVDDVVKIADLEYARKMNDPLTMSHSERSGTALFMSIEAKSHKYEFRGPGKLRARGGLSGDFVSSVFSNDKRSIAKQGSRPVQVQNANKPPPFQHNPLHDIESLWWLTVYLTLYRTADIAGDTNVRRKAQHDYYSHILIDHDARRAAFLLEDDFADNNGCLHPILQPIADALERARQFIANRYKEVEEGNINDIDHTVAAEILPEIYAEIMTNHEMLSSADITLKPIRRQIEGGKEQALPAAAAVGGISLDSRRDAIDKKRPWNETVAQSQADGHSHDGVDQQTGKKAKRARNNLEGPSDVVEADSGSGNRKGKSKAVIDPVAGPSSSSHAGGGDSESRPTVALRRSRRMAKKAAK